MEYNPNSEPDPFRESHMYSTDHTVMKKYDCMGNLLIVEHSYRSPRFEFLEEPGSQAQEEFRRKFFQKNRPYALHYIVQPPRRLCIWQKLQIYSA